MIPLKGVPSSKARPLLHFTLEHRLAVLTIANETLALI